MMRACRTFCLALLLVATGATRAQDADMAQLMKDLRTGDLEARLEAAWALSQIGEAATPAVPALIEALSDDDEGVRLLAASALGAIGPKAVSAAEALRRALNDPDAEVAAQAREALNQIGGSSGPQPASTTGPQPASTTGPLPARTSGEPMPAVTRSQEELEFAIRSLLTRGYTMGLLDDTGNQLNPNVPPDAVSLRPEDVRTHAALIAGGNHRTLGEVVDFLAQVGATLQATGRTITAEDIMPHLQAYVEWCYQNPEDPRAGMGLGLAASAGLVQPPAAPPVLSPDSDVSAVISSMLVVELLSTSLVSSYETNFRGLRVLVKAIEEADRARPGDRDLRVDVLKIIVHLFETANRLAVKLTWAEEQSARHALDFFHRPTTAAAGSPVQAVLFDGVNQVVALRAMTVALPGDTPIRYQQLFRYTVAISGPRPSEAQPPAGALVKQSEARLEPAMPLYISYKILSATPTQLTVNGAPDPFFVRCTVLNSPTVRHLEVEAALRELDIDPFLEEYWPLVSISSMKLSDAKRLLGTWMVRELRPTRAFADLCFRYQAGPDLVIADARGEYREVDPGHFQVRSIITAKNDGQAPSDPQGIIEVKLTYTDAATGAGGVLPGGGRGAGALGPQETWQVDEGWQDFEGAGPPASVTATVHYTPADEQLKEADTTNNRMTYRFTDVTVRTATVQPPQQTPPPVAPAGAAPGLREADLLGRATIGPDMFINSRVHTAGRQVSGAFWFWDRRPQHRQHGFERMDIYANFDGELSSVNENYAAEIAQVKQRGEGEAVVGHFDITGPWQAEKWVPHGNDIETQIVSGQVRVTGYIGETANGAYVAHGNVCFFHAGEENFSWLASSGAWDNELEQARQRMGAEFSMDSFPWHIPDTVK